MPLIYAVQRRHDDTRRCHAFFCVLPPSAADATQMIRHYLRCRASATVIILRRLRMMFERYIDDGESRRQLRKMMPMADDDGDGRMMSYAKMDTDATMKSGIYKR